jgi:hypothetical protein
MYQPWISVIESGMAAAPAGERPRGMSDHQAKRLQACRWAGPSALPDM